MANVSPIQQRIIEMRDKEGLSYKEIGEKLELKYNTVKNYYHKGMAVHRATEAAFDTTPDDSLPAPLTEPLADIDMARELELKAHRILQSIGDVNLATASLYQKASSMGVLIDKARLLRGESTSNVSVQDMRKVNELLPVLMKEAKRRGFIEAEYEEVTS